MTQMNDSVADLIVGLLHPGKMGESVGTCATSNVAKVLWASEGRSKDSKKRAEAAGLHDVSTLANLVNDSNIILSVCPPASALTVAKEVMGQGFSGIYVDCNAVSPDTARNVASIVQTGNADFVDGGIMGPPAKEAGICRLYLSGEKAKTVRKLFEGSFLEAIDMESPIGSASALKMAYAAYTKGSTALLFNVRALAAAEGVEDALVAEWAKSLPELDKKVRSSATRVPQKAWRFIGEMHEIADSFKAVGLPEDFHEGAAEVYERLKGFKDEESELDDVIQALNTSKNI